MAKSGDDRINDCLAYLNEIGQVRLGHLLRRVLAAGLPQGNDVFIDGDTAAAMSGSGLALQSQGWGHRLRSGAKTEKRRAVRTLLLCQAAFLTGMWEKYFGIGAAAPSRVTLVDPGWIEISRSYWMDKSEAQVRDAIACYAPLQHAQPDHLANSFKGTPPKNGVTGQLAWLYLTREQKLVGSDICYSSIMYWMFRTGMVGLPWYLRYSGADTPAALQAGFGPRQSRAWAPQNGPAPTAAQLPLIDRGFVIHIYCEGGGRWKGHWMVCNNRAARRATGCNNGDEGGMLANRTFSNQLDIARQFADYKGQLTQNPATYELGIMDVFNPTLLPDS